MWLPEGVSPDFDDAVMHVGMLDGRGGGSPSKSSVEAEVGNTEEEPMMALTAGGAQANYMMRGVQTHLALGRRLVLGRCALRCAVCSCLEPFVYHTLTLGEHSGCWQLVLKSLFRS